ncbi:retrovirus-related Pol polyprotein from transposon gypsy [Trichonephila clavipes]|nr:retrovirus-related Pol polyprotein from transposon gypsy [Trichonephila clavipes]
MVKEGTIIPNQSPYASSCVVCSKKNGLPSHSPEAYQFAIDYRKLNSITKYPRYPLLLIDYLITNIPHTRITSTLDLRSGYFQLVLNPKDIIKTAFVNKTFTRMPFGLSLRAPNFQKAFDMILKLVLGRFVSVYTDGVIISSPSLTHRVKHLREVFKLLQEAGLTLNKSKCHFSCEELKYLGRVINNEGV